MSKIILQQRQPQRFEGRNIRTPKRSGAKDDIDLLSFEVTREAWEALETIPKTGILEGVIWWSDGDPVGDEVPEEKPEKVKAPKGEWGKYWAAMFKAGFNANRDLIEVLNCSEAGEVKDALKAYFEVQSLTTISPPVFEQFCSHYVMHGLVTLSRQCAAKVQEVTA
jgi:hypothetical protein